MLVASVWDENAGLVSPVWRRWSRWCWEGPGPGEQQAGQPPGEERGRPLPGGTPRPPAALLGKGGQPQVTSPFQLRARTTEPQKRLQNQGQKDRISPLQPPPGECNPGVPAIFLFLFHPCLTTVCCAVKSLSIQSLNGQTSSACHHMHLLNLII